MKTPSKKLKWIDTVMTNFDGGIEADAEERLKAGDCMGGYAAWNFYGYVWWEDGQFHCMVNQYQAHTATLSADTLAGIMEQACEKFGTD